MNHVRKLPKDAQPLTVPFQRIHYAERRFDSFTFPFDSPTVTPQSTPNAWQSSWKADSYPGCPGFSKAGRRSEDWDRVFDLDANIRRPVRSQAGMPSAVELRKVSQRRDSKDYIATIPHRYREIHRPCSTN